ncbi:ABC transporter permease [Symbiopectobacterium purcellii]|uniref:ABC transporter permease subunit n=1 Tax=Symbiopectobacterium purcellii TaxID=2871826 RepID=A0ABX9AVU5_9ENTR|nr:ABC transporter permease subunit [Symbiopectobacterium purcellii]QZN97554.1 ABC transporter permease subunit [Symbiopectobacterium purcellii]
MKTVVLVLLCVLFAPFLAPYDPARSVGLPWQVPDALFWCGTDALGRDVLSRTLHGGVAMLLFSLMATLVASMVGLVTGMGLLVLPDRGYAVTALLDSILMLPPLLIVMMTYYALGPSPLTLLFAIILLNVPFTARFIRALAEPMLDSDYVMVARAAGDSTGLLLRREILPGVCPALLGDGATRLVGAFYLFSAASFLGINAVGQGNDWASMVRESLEGMALNPCALFLPAVSIASVMILINRAVDRRGFR